MNGPAVEPFQPFPVNALPEPFRGFVNVGAIAIGAMADDAGLLPILLAYAAAFVAISAIVLAGREPLLPTRAVRVPTAAAGLLDGGGFALIALALQQGLVSVAASLFALAAPAKESTYRWVFVAAGSTCLAMGVLWVLFPGLRFSLDAGG